MKGIFINNIFKYIGKHKELDEYNQIKIKYGLEVMYNFFVKTFTILLIALIFNSLLEVIFIFLFYGFLRTFIHGAHGKSNTICWTLTLISYSLSIIVIKYVHISLIIKIIISSFSLISMILWAPSDSKFRPLVNKSKRIRFKIISIIITIFYSYIILNTSFKYSSCILVSLVISSIIINPLTYLCLGLKRNNYKLYK